MSRKKIRSVEIVRSLTNAQIDFWLAKMESRLHAIINKKFPKGSLFAAGMGREDLMQMGRELSVRSWTVSRNPFIEEKSRELYRHYLAADEATLDAGGKRAKAKALTVSEDEWALLGRLQWAEEAVRNGFWRLQWETSDKARGGSTVRYDELITDSVRHNEQNDSGDFITLEDEMIDSIDESTREEQEQVEAILNAMEQATDADAITIAREMFMALPPSRRETLTKYLEQRAMANDRRTMQVAIQYDQDEKADEIATVVEIDE